MSKPKSSTLPVYRVNANHPYPQKSMVNISASETPHGIRYYPDEHFFDINDAWVALEDVFRDRLQKQTARYYEMKKDLAEKELELATIEADLTKVVRREGMA